MRRDRTGFTLIELVVVILILGILAGVGAPKLFSTSGLATENGCKQTLSLIRDGIELYAAENGGTYPPCTTTGADFRTAMEDYVRGKFPVSPVGAADNLITPSNTTPLAPNDATGWMYNPSTGEFICNSTEVVPSDGITTYGQL
jgi:general secretion pathway protein G